MSNLFIAHGCCGCKQPPTTIATTTTPQTTTTESDVWWESHLAEASTTAPATTRNWPTIPLPGICTKGKIGVGYSGPAIGDPVAGVHGHACAVLCSLDKRCTYWLVHETKGCILKAYAPPPRPFSLIRTAWLSAPAMPAARVPPAHAHPQQRMHQ